MASLFGSVATEVGGAVTDIAVDKRDDRRIDEESQREMQLQKQRMQHDSSLLDKRIKSDATRAKRREDFEGTMFDRETERSATQATTESERDITSATVGHTRVMEVEELRSQTDIAREYIKQYYARSAQKTLSGNGWTVEFERDSVIDPSQPSGFRQVEYVNAKGPDGRAWKIQGADAFYGGELNPVAHDFGGGTDAVGKKQAAEEDLYAGKWTAEDYYRSFGYIPSGYIFGQVSRDDAGLQDSMRRDGIRIPAYLLDTSDRRRSGGDDKGRIDDEPLGAAAGGSSANSASAELRALAEKEGRDPTPDETDAILRKYRDRQGLDEYPPGVEPGDMGSPYQSDFEGSDGTPTEFGQRVLDSSGGGLLDEGAEGEFGPTPPEIPPEVIEVGPPEMIEKLRMGDIEVIDPEELDRLVAEAQGDSQSPFWKWLQKRRVTGVEHINPIVRYRSGKPTLNDEDAASIASYVEKWMSGEARVGKKPGAELRPRTPDEIRSMRERGAWTPPELEIYQEEVAPTEVE